MKQAIVGTAIIIVGLTSIIFKKEYVNFIIKSNNDGGLGFYHYGKKEAKVLLWSTFLLGLLFILSGSLILFGVWKLR